MRKSLVRITSAASVLALAFSLSACSGDAKAPEETNSTTTSTTDAETETPDPTTDETSEETAAGVTADCTSLNEELNSVMTMLSDGMSKVQNGEATPGEVYGPVIDRLNMALGSLTTDEIKEPLKLFIDEVKETSNISDKIDYKKVAAGDADAIAEAQEVIPELQEQVAALPIAGEKIDAACRAN
ncbi:hypothetical protein [Timonella senegalensis]|uniref:hypothetical protein n=1 Tax=Timonella senegalensis TaxID=1465825 RepID=UPI00030CF6F2|nr:hypothetical protein [Timonella senegalensis]